MRSLIKRTRCCCCSLPHQDGQTEPSSYCSYCSYWQLQWSGQFCSDPKMTVLTARAAPSAADSSRFGSWAYRVGKCEGVWDGGLVLDKLSLGPLACGCCRLTAGYVWCVQCVQTADWIQAAVPCRGEVETLSRLRSDGAREGSQRYVSCVGVCLCLSLLKLAVVSLSQ